jgi:hypothetical protein
MSRDYIELLCSLPDLKDPFVHRRPPISSVQLRKRLRMLDFDDQELIRELSESFYWGSIAFEDSDRVLVERSRRAIHQVEQDDLREWLVWRMDLRTVIAALRRRHRGEDSAPVNELWGYGSYTRYIERNWSHPYFRLESRFPWLPEARVLLEAGESFDLERLLLSAAWRYYDRQQPDSAYSISAIWLYLMRWDLVDRWCSYNAEAAQSRFNELVSSGLETPLDELRKIA